MSVVIVGGHDRMVSQYVKICKSFNCKAKVFTQMTADFGKQIGAPDLLVLFTSTVSHKMIRRRLMVQRKPDRSCPLPHQQQNRVGRNFAGTLCSLLTYLKAKPRQILLLGTYA